MRRSLLRVNNRPFVVLFALFVFSVMPLVAQEKKQVQKESVSTTTGKPLPVTKSGHKKKGVKAKHKRKKVVVITHHSDNDKELEKIKEEKNKMKGAK